MDKILLTKCRFCENIVSAELVSDINIKDDIHYLYSLIDSNKSVKITGCQCELNYQGVLKVKNKLEDLLNDLAKTIDCSNPPKYA